MMQTTGSQLVLKYEIVGVRFRHVDKASRFALAAVTPKLTGKVLHKDIGETQLGLIRAWRARIREMSRQGYRTVQDPSMWNLLYNCPPVGVVTKLPNQRVCGKSVFCPFCWCRKYVHPAYQRLAKFYLGNDEDHPEHNHLLEAVDTTEYPVEQGVLEHIFRDLRKERRMVYDYYKPIGGVQIMSVILPDPREPIPKWRTQVRLLAVMPENYNIEVHEPGAVQIHKSITHKVLVSAVGRTFRYPAQTLRGPAHRAAELANFLDGYGREGAEGRTAAGGTQVKGFRLFSTYGELRG